LNITVINEGLTLMDFRQESLLEKSTEIVGWFATDYLREDGLPFSFLDSTDGRITYYEHILSDLGDYLPFIRFFGNEQFCRQQVEALRVHLKHGILKPRTRLFGIPLTTAFEHTDLVLGLMDYYLLDKDGRILELAIEIMDQLLRKFYHNNAFHSFYLHGLNMVVPVFSSIDGTYIELLVNLHSLTGESRYLKAARDIWLFMRNIPTFRERGLFPHLHIAGNSLLLSKASNFFQGFRAINLMKDNTNSAFAFLELYKVDHNPEVETEINRWTSSVERDALSKEGGAYWCMELSGEKIRVRSGVNLTASFAVIDFLCDCGWILKQERFLTLAKRIADFWLGLQGTTTGLFPSVPDTSGSYLDSETDMIIALVKLHELTGEARYRESALRAFDGILRYHRRDRGYIMSVNIENGETINPAIKTKFVSLFLKALILFISEKEIYQNPWLHNLLKDR